MLDLVTFSPVASSMEELPPEVWKDLSSDQKLLYRYVIAIRDGNVPPSLVYLRCGPISHIRWLTLATRLLILYTRTTDPCDGLKTVVEFIMKVYAPLWFRLKKNNNFIHGPSAIFTAIKLISQQPDSVRKIVMPVVQHNGWFAEVGIMLCSMLASEDRRIREKAVESILQRRTKPLKKPRKGIVRGIRKIEVNPLQSEAETWDQIIDWTNVTIHEPYILEILSREQIETAREGPLVFPHFPLHSQSVERAVKNTSESSTQVNNIF